MFSVDIDVSPFLLRVYSVFSYVVRLLLNFSASLAFCRCIFAGFLVCSHSGSRHIECAAVVTVIVSRCCLCRLPSLLFFSTVTCHRCTSFVFFRVCVFFSYRMHSSSRPCHVLVDHNFFPSPYLSVHVLFLAFCCTFP
ncbi:unnamed protein product, partial [Sphacelaria rigidula]